MLPLSIYIKCCKKKVLKNTVSPMKYTLKELWDD